MASSLCRSAAKLAISRALFSKPLVSKSLPSPLSFSTRSIVGAWRVASVVGSVESLMPLHSAIANARLKSVIAVDSSCWRGADLGTKFRVCHVLWTVEVICGGLRWTALMNEERRLRTSIRGLQNLPFSPRWSKMDQHLFLFQDFQIRLAADGTCVFGYEAAADGDQQTGAPPHRPYLIDCLAFLTGLHVLRRELLVSAVATSNEALDLYSSKTR